MNPEQATELVDELLQACVDYEFYKDKYYREDFLEVKQRVIAALIAVHTPQESANG